MALGSGKLQVIEQKLEIYEDLSQKMLDKLERAVTTISENSNRVSVVLERHENRLDEGEKSNNLILQMLQEIKELHEKDTDTLHSRISTLAGKVEQNQRFVYGAGAVLATIVGVAQLLPIFGWTLTPVDKNASMSGVERSVNVLS